MDFWVQRHNPCPSPTGIGLLYHPFSGNQPTRRERGAGVEKPLVNLNGACTTEISGPYLGDGLETLGTLQIGTGTHFTGNRVNQDLRITSGLPQFSKGVQLQRALQDFALHIRPGNESYRNFSIAAFPLQLQPNQQSRTVVEWRPWFYRRLVAYRFFWLSERA
jgi:hypothetical protein